MDNIRGIYLTEIAKCIHSNRIITNILLKNKETNTCYNVTKQKRKTTW